MIPDAKQPEREKTLIDKKTGTEIIRNAKNLPRAAKSPVGNSISFLAAPHSLEDSS